MIELNRLEEEEEGWKEGRREGDRKEMKEKSRTRKYGDRKRIRSYESKEKKGKNSNITNQKWKEEEKHEEY